uniref:ZZ-type domain-containing protein n=1 Tax=Steinernema glaseri TaxID=37863 RepID=A0A1I7YWH3_9BILA
MKELEIINDIVQLLPRCTKCKNNLMLQDAEHSEQFDCNFRSHEDAPYGCSLDTLYRCGHCKRTFSRTVHYSKLVKQIAEVHAKYVQGMTEQCSSCNGKLFSDHIFCCMKCKALEELLCANCAVANHNGVGHYLLSAREQCPHILKVIKKLFENTTGASSDDEDSPISSDSHSHLPSP